MNQPRGPRADLRSLAAEIECRMGQLAEDEVPRSAILGRMTAFVVEIGQISSAIADEHFAALRREFPGFHSFAVLIEEMADAELQNSTRPYDEVTALPEAIKERLSSLVSTATTLERDYQSLSATDESSASPLSHKRLKNRHDQWKVDLEGFVAEIKAADLPQRASGILLPILERLDEHVAILRTRTRQR